MSDPDKPDYQHTVRSAPLIPFEGVRAPGGCTGCDAYQMPEAIAAVVWIIHIYHDDWCPREGANAK